VAVVVIHCNDLTVIVLKMYKEAAVISALLKVYSIPCHDTGHINVMLVLQSCTDPLHNLPGSSSETFPISSDGACNFTHTEIGAINEETADRTQEELTLEDINSPEIKSEPNEVIYVLICLLLGGESNGKLPLRFCPGCSVSEPDQSRAWALVPAQTGPRANY
jgi:hypothetical protein